MLMLLCTVLGRSACGGRSEVFSWRPRAPVAARRGGGSRPTRVIVPCRDHAGRSCSKLEPCPAFCFLQAKLALAQEQ